MSVDVPIPVSFFLEEIINSKNNTTLCCSTEYSQRYCDANKTTFNCSVLHMNFLFFVRQIGSPTIMTDNNFFFNHIA